MIGKMCGLKAHLNCGNTECSCSCHTWLPSAMPLIKAMLGNPPGMEARK